MGNSTSQSLKAIALVLIIASAVAWAGSQESTLALGVPLFAFCGAISFALNWLIFFPSYLFQTEHYYDLTGSISYGVLVACAIGLGGAVDPRSLLLSTLVVIWAVRLGSFLFGRVRRDGSDGRFDTIKPDFARFLMTWTLQALWVFLTLSCALAAICSNHRVPLGVGAAIGTALWLLGFGIEVLADEQKRRFRADPANRDRFITTGLWAWSRHPNYFGEITLWLGVALIALPALTGWSYVTLVSPIFVVVLLTRISGIPLLESRAKKKWGGDPEFQAYKQRTPALLLRPPAAAT